MKVHWGAGKGARESQLRCTRMHRGAAQIGRVHEYVRVDKSQGFQQGCASVHRDAARLHKGWETV